MSEQQHEDVPPLPPDLRAWLDERSSEERTELRRTWELSGLARDVGQEQQPVDTEAGWSQVAAALAEEETPRRQPPRQAAPDGSLRRSAPSAERAASRAPKRSARAWRRRAVAAALVLLLVAGALFWRLRPVSVRAPAGEQVRVELPGGSTAMLNSGSRLVYRRGLLGWGGLLQDERSVRLRGEAFFDVVYGEGRFTVHTFNARVQVLGTRFNVRARPEQGAGRDTAAVPVTAVVLAEGRVRLAATGAPRQPVTLAPGQASRVVGNTAVPTPPEAADVKAVTAWRRGGLVFSASSFAEIVAEVERRFGVQVRVADPALRRDTVSLYLPQATEAASVLRDLCAYRGCTVRQTSAGFVLEAPPDAP